MSQPRNPYGKRPGGGISLPDYYRPMTTINNRNVYFPGTEVLPEGEMRIIVLGSEENTESGCTPTWWSGPRRGT